MYATHQCERKYVPKEIKQKVWITGVGIFLERGEPCIRLKKDIWQEQEYSWQPIRNSLELETTQMPIFSRADA